SPVLLHCQRGADRTGLAAAVALLLQPGTGYAEARRQLGWRYGHVALSHPANLDRFFDLYTDWLRQQGLEHSPAVFRRWASDGYRPAAYWATLELLDPTCLAAWRRYGLRVRAHNTSGRPWRLRPGENAGIHMVFALYDEQGRAQYGGRAGLFDAEV